MTADTQVSLIADDLKRKFLRLYCSQRINRELYNYINHEKAIHAMATLLLRSGSYILPVGGIELRLVNLKDFENNDFPFVLILLNEDLEAIAKKGLCTFLGHRFLPHITWPLRFNLVTIIEPYEIDLSLADEDLMSGPVLDIISSKVNDAQFAIFDNRETETKPNVYIELGIAYDMGKPFILFDYRDPAKATENVIPSNLAGFLSVRYNDYKDLFDEFSLKLPIFAYENLTVDPIVKTINLRE